MLEATGAVLLWGVLPCAIMVLAVRLAGRGRAPSGRALSVILALQLVASVVLAVAIPEIVAPMLFTAPTAPGDHLDFGPGLFIAGATSVMASGFGAALLINAWVGIAALRRSARAQLRDEVRRKRRTPGSP